MDTPGPDIFRQLIADASWDEREVSRRLALATDSAYWQSLTADLSLDAAAIGDAGTGTQDAARLSATEELAADHTFHLARVVPIALVQRINLGIDAVVAEGWPASFVFAFGEPWTIVRTPLVRAVVESRLGAGAQQMRAVWAHVVRSSAGATGWRPHVDAPEQGRMTTWCALTDVTTDSGCMHVLPRAFEPKGITERLRGQGEPFSAAEVSRALHGVRAMPAAAGDVLGWAFDLVHWGGPMRRGAPERRALSFEFISRDQVPDEDEHPLFSLDVVPPFGQRLRAIAIGMLGYTLFEPRLHRSLKFAEALVARA